MRIKASKVSAVSESSYGQAGAGDGLKSNLKIACHTKLKPGKMSRRIAKEIIDEVIPVIKTDHGRGGWAETNSQCHG